MRGILHLRRFVLAAACAALLTIGAQSQTGEPKPSAKALPAGFKERALGHVQRLASRERVAGTQGETLAAAYIQEQMRQTGLSVTTEPFRFQSFSLESATLKTEKEQADIVRLGFDPYTGGEGRSGEVAFVDPGDDVQAILRAELDGRIVVTTEPANFFRIALLKKPLAVAYLSRPDFDRVRAAGPRSGDVAFRGKTVTLSSSNVIGVLPSGTGAGREIIVSAHYDSWTGPGAGDNASGVAVMLELARHFASLKPALPVSLRFVAFGAEELGMMGARAYLEKHQGELQNCVLLFNIDTVGGNKEIYTDTRGGVRGIPAKPASQLPRETVGKATGDIAARWLLLGPDQRPLFESSNAPQWLRSAIEAAGADLGREIISANGMGSDHRIFVQAGVVATNIAISGGLKIHTLEDVPASISGDGLETAARIVAAVVEKASRPGN
jgi:hypothetical protein